MVNKDVAYINTAAYLWGTFSDVPLHQGSSERVRCFAERVLNGRSDQKIKNAFRTRSFRCNAFAECEQTCLKTINPVSLYLLSCRRLSEGADEI